MTQTGRLPQQTRELRLDLRSVRTEFFGKDLSYALSFEYNLQYEGPGVPNERSVRLLVARPKPPHHVVGTVFHVLGVDRVPGLDKRGRDVPLNYRLSGRDETLVLRAEKKQAVGLVWSFATFDGRMMLDAGDGDEKTDDEPIRISLSYDGTLQLLEPIRIEEVVPKLQRTIVASAFASVFFETTHPKYHWLTENACIAYGTWALDEKGKIAASFDVYAVS